MSYKENIKKFLSKDGIRSETIHKKVFKWADNFGSLPIIGRKAMKSVDTKCIIAQTEPCISRFGSVVVALVKETEGNYKKNIAVYYLQ